VYFILEKKNWPFSRYYTIFLSCVIILVVVIKDIYTPLQPYDKEHLYGVTHASLKDVIATFATPVVKMFFYRCLINYWLGIIVFITGMVMLLKSKKTALAIWTFGCVLGYIIIMGLTYGNLDSSVFLFHIETEWASIGIIVATPFVFAFLPKLKTATATGLLGGIFIIRLVYIVSCLQQFTLRNDMKEQLLSQMRKKGIKKLALYNDDHLRKVAILDWALTYESVLMSSLDGDKPQLTFFFVNPDDKQTLEKIKDPNSFYDVWSVGSGSGLNKEYYNIDTTQPYQVMTYADFLK
jgi:hypothetical protein